MEFKVILGYGHCGVTNEEEVTMTLKELKELLRKEKKAIEKDREEDRVCPHCGKTETEQWGRVIDAYLDAQ